MEEVEPECEQEDARECTRNTTTEKAKAEELLLEYVVKYKTGSEVYQFISEFLCKKMDIKSKSPKKKMCDTRYRRLSDNS